MNKQKIKNQIKARRKGRVRSRILGTAKRPRLSVFRSLKHVYVQLIDDTKGKTLVSVKDSEVIGKTKIEKALALGKLLAEKAKAAKIEAAVFDKGAYRFHGRTKAIADGAKKAGLKL